MDDEATSKQEEKALTEGEFHRVMQEFVYNQFPLLPPRIEFRCQDKVLGCFVHPGKSDQENEMEMNFFESYSSDENNVHVQFAKTQLLPSLKQMMNFNLFCDSVCISNANSPLFSSIIRGTCLDGIQTDSIPVFLSIAVYFALIMDSASAQPTSLHSTSPPPNTASPLQEDIDISDIRTWAKRDEGIDYIVSFLTENQTRVCLLQDLFLLAKRLHCTPLKYVFAGCMLYEI